MDDKSVADRVVEYFGAVSDLLPVLDWDSHPVGGPDTPMDLLTEAEVKQMLDNAKKPSSMVAGTFSRTFIVNATSVE